MAKGGNLIGSWAFLVGVILAVIFGFWGELNLTMTWILVLIGLIVGLLNIADKEAGPFLMSGAILIIVSALGAGVMKEAVQVMNILGALLTIFVPAVIVVAIRNVFSLAKK